MQQSALELSGLFASAFISSTIAPGGSEVILLLMINQHHYPVEGIVAIATIGNTLGAITTWGLGAITAKKFPAANLLSKKKQQVLHFVRRKGLWTLFFSWLPVVGDALCFAGGWLQMPLLPASLLILLGKLSRYAALAWIAS